MARHQGDACGEELLEEDGGFPHENQRDQDGLSKEFFLNHAGVYVVSDAELSYIGFSGKLT